MILTMLSANLTGDISASTLSSDERTQKANIMILRTVLIHLNTLLGAYLSLSYWHR